MDPSSPPPPPPGLDFSLPASVRRARFRSCYNELELHRTVLKTYTKPLFAWRKALARSHDGRTLYDFARRTPQNLERLHALLARGEFHFREGLELRYNFNGRIRTIHLFPWEERIVDLLLYRMLNRRFHGVLSPHAYAYRHRGLGVDVCQRRIARRLADATGPVYFLKRDVADYFPSIDHEILSAAVSEWIEPGDYLHALVSERIRFRVRDGDAVRTAERGIPFGSAIACFFANLFLTPLDRALGTVPGLAYFRYADDLLAFSSDREAVLEARRRFDAILGALRLRSNPDHEHDFAFLDAGADDGQFERATKFRHLGLEFRVSGEIGLSRDKGRKIRNLFRFAFRRARRKFRAADGPEGRARVAVDIARDIVENGFRSVALIDYYLKHVSDEEQLRLLDRWLAEEVLSRAFGNGHRKGNFGKLPFARLREMGLPSLRHRRRLLRHGQLQSSFFILRTERLIEREGRRSPGHRTFSPGREAAAIQIPREKEGRL